MSLRHSEKKRKPENILDSVAPNDLDTLLSSEEKPPAKKPSKRKPENILDSVGPNDLDTLLSSEEKPPAKKPSKLKQDPLIIFSPGRYTFSEPPKGWKTDPDSPLVKNIKKTRFYKSYASKNTGNYTLYLRGVRLTFKRERRVDEKDFALLAIYTKLVQDAEDSHVEFSDEDKERVYRTKLYKNIWKNMSPGEEVEIRGSRVMKGMPGCENKFLLLQLTLLNKKAKESSNKRAKASRGHLLLKQKSVLENPSAPLPLRDSSLRVDGWESLDVDWVLVDQKHESVHYQRWEACTVGQDYVVKFRGCGITHLTKNEKRDEGDNLKFFKLFTRYLRERKDDVTARLALKEAIDNNEDSVVGDTGLIFDDGHTGFM